MNGIVNDIKTIVSKLKDYRTEHNHSFWNSKRIFNVIIKTLQKTWVLILLGLLVFLSTAILAITNAFGEILYFSLIIIYIFVCYVIINVTLFTFKYINKHYYDELRIDKKVIKRISKLGAFLVSVTFVVGLGFIQIHFVNNYINAPIAGYSYYDEYGNLIYEQRANIKFSNGEKGTYTVKDVNVNVNEDQSLNEVELVLNYKDTYKKIIQVSYENERITQIVETDHCTSEDVDDWYKWRRSFLPANDGFDGRYVFRYSTRETVIKYRYEPDAFTQNKEVNYHIYGNDKDKKLLQSTFEEQVFKKVLHDSRVEIIIDQDSHSRKLYGDQPFIVDLRKNGIIEHLQYEFADRYKEFTNEEIYERATHLMNENTVTKTDYELKLFYDENQDIILQNYRNEIKFSRDNTNREINDSYQEFAGIKDFIRTKTSYEKNYLSTEFQQLVYDEDDVRTVDYDYKHIYNNDGLKRIDQYTDEDELINRHLFKDTKYGTVVTHYSYNRESNYKFADANSNQLNHYVSYAWVPLTLQKSLHNTTGDLVYQELPYLYLLESDEE